MVCNVLGRLSRRPARHVVLTPQHSIVSIAPRLVSGVRYGRIARCEEQSKTEKPATETLQPGGSAGENDKGLGEPECHSQ